MKNTSSRTLAVIARILLLMFVFGLLSQSVQACTLSKPHDAMASMADRTPCHVTAMAADAHSKCATGNQIHADDCSVQAPVATSNERLPSSSAPVAMAAVAQLASLVTPHQIIGLAAAPPVNPRPHIPLSILHCSFQI